MPIRNPFRKTIGGIEVHDQPIAQGGADRSLSKTSASRPIDVKEPAEYKLSEINDSGVCLPPSPVEQKGFWISRSNASTTSSSHRSILGDNEPFSISRESFESYRRSFDISGRCPVADIDGFTRTSLDSRRARLPLRTSLSDARFDRPQPTPEADFEDVGLNDDAKPKRRGLFARFGDSSETTENTSNSRPSSMHGFHLTSRKRGSIGQGSELNAMPRPVSRRTPEVKVDS